MPEPTLVDMQKALDGFKAGIEARDKLIEKLNHQLHSGAFIDKSNLNPDLLESAVTLLEGWADGDVVVALKKKAEVEARLLATPIETQLTILRELLSEAVPKCESCYHPATNGMLDASKVRVRRPATKWVDDYTGMYRHFYCDEHAGPACHEYEWGRKVVEALQL